MPDRLQKDQSGSIQDISIEELNEKGLNSLLKSKIPLLYFLIYTLSTKCAESLVITKSNF